MNRNTMFRKLNIGKSQLSPRSIYRFNTIPNKIPAAVFVETNKLILKFIGKCKGCRVAKITEKEQNWKIYTPWIQDLQSYNNQDIVVLMYKQTKKSMEQKSPETDTQIYELLVSTKVQSHISTERIVFPTNGPATI